MRVISQGVEKFELNRDVGNWCHFSEKTFHSRLPPEHLELLGNAHLPGESETACWHACCEIPELGLRKMKSLLRHQQFLLPAIFFLVLGLGNVGVGMYRTSQYDGVVEQLSGSQTRRLESASALGRLRLAGQARDRDELRRQRARVKRDFYEFVIFGGKVFLLLSALLFGIALIRHSRQAIQDDFA